MPIAIVYGLIALAILGTLGTAAHKLKESGRDEVRLEWRTAEEAARKREAAAAAKAEADLAAERARRKIVYRTITKEVEREVEKPVYRNICLPPTGVLCVNAAIRGESAAACQPDGTMPPARTTD